MTYQNTERGFNLIEVAIVMVIIAFMLGSLLGPLGNRMEQAKIEQTSAQINDVLDAIYGFVLINNQFPCPAITVPGVTFGTENRNAATGICNVITGEPPWVTLGTSRFDAWGQNFIYRVDTAFADNPPSTDACIVAPAIPNPNVSFEICSVGNINVWTNATLVNPVALTVPAIVISRGKPRSLAVVIPDENENTDGDVDFVSRDFLPETSPTPFNDIVRWIPTNVLMGKMVQAQRLP